MQMEMESIAVSSENVNFFSIDTDENIIAATEFQVRSIPSTILFKNGRVVADIIGAVPKEVISQQIRKHSFEPAKY